MQLGVSESSRGCSLVVLAFTECEPCSIAGGGGKGGGGGGEVTEAGRPSCGGARQALIPGH